MCASFLHGHACSNEMRVRRNAAEAVVLERVRSQLREPPRVKVMVAEMQRHLAQLLKERAARSAEAPAELKELEG